MIKKHTLEVRHIRIDSPKSLTSSARKECAATRSDSHKSPGWWGRKAGKSWKGAGPELFIFQVRDHGALHGPFDDNPLKQTLPSVGIDVR